ncbi:50S ribosomal protein L11 methyltransferase [Roseicyclus mahoneyensis]|jgi:ribosomal protein L11 methyltransferase|uniref:Ribosomal protein L11 methyltransferase n=1 Tax=Roseicyclus mahoneyensis TaxID=164332 RepID=A0A316GEF2_9RHOB|nr:50S ribosomal protein L11 methyltransferase [Roseicyclus mahoneyensis]PWK59379.1 [LSU ribosomal protein L11P]-lysine N-methyltransferase [Roseicyclus mahoneyensis]
MPTWTALTTLADKDLAEALGEALEDLEPAPSGVGVFEMEDGSGLWEVGGYFLELPDDIALTILAVAHEAKPFTVSEVPETDWVAHVRRELHPVEAGRFFVYGSHDADKLPEGRVGLLIEAAMAFGTGHHGTTQGCLEAMDKLLTDGVRPVCVADIGCGTAVLAIAAAKVLDGVVIASDIDPVAVDVAVANAVANGVGGRIACVEAAGFEHPLLAKKAPYDLVFANILKGPLIDLAPSAAAHVGAGGHIILSGILNPQAEAVLAAYQVAGFTFEDRRIIGDWTTLTLRR